MKPYLKLSALFLILSLAVSCKKEGCLDNMAENYSSDVKKDDGSCTYARTKFMGNYNVDESCAVSGSSEFVMSVTDGPAKDEILIHNFGNFDINIRAKVSGANISFKEEQAGVIYEGTGYIAGNTMTITYEACESFFYPCSDPESCTMTCTKY